MRKILIFPILFSLLLFGCGGRTERMRTLLLQQDSLNRAYVPFTTDSTVRLLADYFDRHGTNLDRVLAHYLLGSALRDIREAPAALDEFQKAAELADTTQGGDSIFALLAKVHGQMGYLFSMQYLPIAAKGYYHNAQMFSLRCKDTIGAMEFENFLNSAYYQEEKYDSVDILTREMADKYLALGDTATAALDYGIAIAANIKRGRLEDAARQMYAYEHYSGAVDGNGAVKEPFRVYDYYRGLFHLKKGDAAKANKYFRDLLLQPNNLEMEKDAYHGLSLLYGQLGMYDSAYHYSMLYSDANDTCYKHQNSEKLYAIQSLYNYGRLQHLAQRNATERDRTRRLVAILVFSMLMGTVLFVLYRKQKLQQFLQNRLLLVQKSHEIDELEEAADELRRSLAAMETEMRQVSEENTVLAREVSSTASKKDMLEKEILEKEEQIGYLRRLLTAYRPEGKEEQQFHMMAKIGLPLQHIDWETIYKKVSDNDAVFLSNLKKCPSLTEYELRICVLTRLGFKVYEVANLLGKSTADITNKRRSLLRKIFNVDESAKRFEYRISTL